jgi:type I restriction-modification system DNA methylase subunit
MLGRFYEYLIKMFADDAGKKGGEFYTPSRVVELNVKLIKPEEGNGLITGRSLSFTVDFGIFLKNIVTDI